MGFSHRKINSALSTQFLFVLLICNYQNAMFSPLTEKKHKDVLLNYFRPHGPCGQQVPLLQLAHGPVANT